MKIKCKCGKLAVWLYGPGDDRKEHACCDDCVPRGCTCNNYPIDEDWENVDPENWTPELDEQGRQYPCCEWWYDEEGFDE